MKEMNMITRVFRFWLPCWERWSGLQRAASVDFGLSFAALLLSASSDSVFFTLLCVANLVRSWHRVRKCGVTLDED